MEIKNKKMTIKVKDDNINWEVSPIFILKVLSYYFNVEHPKFFRLYFLKNYMIFQTSMPR